MQQCADVEIDMQATRRELDALIVLLEDWADWQHGHRYSKGLGYPAHSPGMGGARISSFDDMADEVDAATMRIVDAAVNDLPPAPRAAIMRRYGIAAVFRFPRNNYAQCLSIAHDELMTKLSPRIARLSSTR